ncbi:MAG TPA: hypothetical protein VES42_25020 [Pilimelia sp.]|nr:hypothetical protein [Pilimelia sp.]
MRRGSSIGAFIIIVWLLIGLLAAIQRGYFKDSDTNCAEAGAIALTVIAGPLNYVGLNPKIDCELPQPSE